MSIDNAFPQPAFIEFTVAVELLSQPGLLKSHELMHSQIGTRVRMTFSVSGAESIYMSKPFTSSELARKEGRRMFALATKLEKTRRAGGAS